jgi:triphosphatase
MASEFRHDLETELKFHVSSEALAALRKHPALAGSRRAENLLSVYFDTPDSRLRQAGVSLRVREQDGTFVQTLKSIGGQGLFDRAETEAQIETARPELARLKGTRAAPVLNRHARALRPVFATNVERTVRTWRRGGGAVEISLDEGEVSAGRERGAICELELELKKGGEALLFELARDLSLTIPLILAFESKACRGYRLAGHDERTAEMAQDPRVLPTCPAEVAFRRVVRSCLAQVAANTALFARLRSPEALHQSRVGLRRLRAALGAFKTIVDDNVFPRIEAEIRWLAGELDEARDLDVFIRSAFRPAEQLNLNRDALAAYGKRLLRAKAAAYDRGVAAIESARFSTLMLDTSEWVQLGPWTSTEDPLQSEGRAMPTSEFGPAALDELFHAVRKAAKHLRHTGAEGRHQLRIKAKKLRYACEFFGGAFDESRRKREFMSALRGLLDDLGALNDIAVAAEIGIGAARNQPVEIAFVAGQVVGARQAGQAALTAGADRGLKILRTLKPFWSNDKA